MAYFVQNKIQKLVVLGEAQPPAIFKLKNDQSLEKDKEEECNSLGWSHVAVDDDYVLWVCEKGLLKKII